MSIFVRNCLRFSSIGQQIGRRSSFRTLTTIINPGFSQSVNVRFPLIQKFPSTNSRKIPTELPSKEISSEKISIVDKFSLNEDLFYYECPSIVNESMKCAWTSTNYRYRRQRKVRNHPSRLKNTVNYRSRRMRLHHKKKWLKKFKYDLLKKLREKIRRRGKLFQMENEIILGKAEQFNAEHYVRRELEKAKFYGYRVSPIYDQIRHDIERLKIE